jgi:hypothetical protein
MIDLSTENIDGTNLDRVEEIYLTEKQYIRWMSADTPRPDIFGRREGRVALEDMQTTDQPWSEPDCHKKMRALIERAFGPSANQTADRPVAPPPKPVRKLERPADAVWTFFRHASLVVGVHDNGTVVGRLTHWWPCNHEYRVTPDGVLHEHNKPVGERFMADGAAKRIHGDFKRALTSWVKRGEGRKIPVGIRRLKKAIDSCSQGAGGSRSKEYFDRDLRIEVSDLFK